MCMSLVLKNGLILSTAVSTQPQHSPKSGFQGVLDQLRVPAKHGSSKQMDSY